MRKTRSDHYGYYREIGKKVAYYRKKRKMTQNQLAEKIGISKSYLSKIEAPNSTDMFSLDVLLDIAKGLDVDIGVFWQAPVCPNCGQEFSVEFCFSCGSKLGSGVGS